MQKNTGVIIAVVALLVGLGIGYVSASSKTPIAQDSSMSGMQMTDTMSSMNADLQGKTGDDFDKAFLSGMIVHHQGAVQMAQAALISAEHQEIKDLAAGIISAQNKEIAEMQAWQESWYNQ